MTTEKDDAEDRRDLAEYPGSQREREVGGLSASA
jgi:hypothetical protein